MVRQQLVGQGRLGQRPQQTRHDVQLFVLVMRRGGDIRSSAVTSAAAWRACSSAPWALAWAWRRNSVSGVRRTRPWQAASILEGCFEPYPGPAYNCFVVMVPIVENARYECP